jgi:hypothetical protein
LSGSFSLFFLSCFVSTSAIYSGGDFNASCLCISDFSGADSKFQSERERSIDRTAANSLGSISIIEVVRAAIIQILNALLNAIHNIPRIHCYIIAVENAYQPIVETLISQSDLDFCVSQYIFNICI